LYFSRAAKLPVAVAMAAALSCVALPACADTMPQFDFANPLLRAQVVWGAIIFVALYIAASRVGLPAVAAVLEARAATIGGDLEQARLAGERADRAVAELNEARRVAYAEAQAALAGATQRAKEAADTKSAEVNARLDRQLADSRAQIEAAHASAMTSLSGVAAEAAEALVARLAGRPADPARVRAAVAAALGARGLAGA
jgi:F-type H+-transporting ATPase subunit b